MDEKKPKLPRSVVILNIIMVILILVICVLVFSLAFSTYKKENESSGSKPNSISVSSDDTKEDEKKETKESSEPQVSMTKADGEDSRPSEQEPNTETGQTFNPPEESSETSSNGTAPTGVSYDREFFKDDLFIGDSITTGFYAYDKLDMRNVAAAVGYTPYKAWHTAIELYDGTSATALEYAKAMQPKRIYIMLGSNGLLESYAMKGSYTAFLDELILACPESEIYCMSIAPVTSDSSAAAYSGITNQMALDFNDYIKNTICVDYGLEYLDICTLLSDSDGYFSHDYAEVDGMHFKGATYDVVLNYIENAVSG